MKEPNKRSGVLGSSIKVLEVNFTKLPPPSFFAPFEVSALFVVNQWVFAFSSLGYTNVYWMCLPKKSYPINNSQCYTHTHTHTKFKNLKNGGFFNFCSKRIGIMRHTRSHTRLNVYTHTRSTLHKQNMLKHLNNKHKFSYTNTLKLYTYKDT